MNLRFTIEAGRPSGTIFRIGLGGDLLSLALCAIELLARLT